MDSKYKNFVSAIPERKKENDYIPSSAAIQMLLGIVGK